MQRVNIDDTETGDDLSLLYQGQPYTGEVVETYQNGTTAHLASYQNGREHGQSRMWYPNGQLKWEATAKNGAAVGTAREWYSGGQLAVEKLFTNDGELVFVREWSEDGRLASDSLRGPFGQSRRIALRVLADEVEETDGVMRHNDIPFTGEVAEFYQDDAVASLTEYARGHKVERRAFHPNGMYAERRRFKNGKPVGYARIWRPNGDLLEQTWYTEEGETRTHKAWPEH